MTFSVQWFVEVRFTIVYVFSTEGPPEQHPSGTSLLLTIEVY